MQERMTHHRIQHPACNTITYLQHKFLLSSLSRMWPQQPRFIKSTGLCHSGPYRSEYAMARSWHHWSVEADNRAGMASLPTWALHDHSISEWRRCLRCAVNQNDRHTEHILLTVRTAKSLLQTLKYFLEHSMTSFANYQPAAHVLIHVVGTVNYVTLSLR